MSERVLKVRTMGKDLYVAIPVDARKWLGGLAGGDYVYFKNVDGKTVLRKVATP